MSELRSRKGNVRPPFVVGEFVLAANVIRNKLSIQEVFKVTPVGDGLWEVVTTSTKPDEYPAVVAQSLADGAATCISKLRKGPAEKLIERLEDLGSRNLELDPDYKAVVEEASQRGKHIEIPKNLRRFLTACLPIEPAVREAPVLPRQPVLVADPKGRTLTVRLVDTVSYSEARGRWNVTTTAVDPKDTTSVLAEMDIAGRSALIAPLDAKAVNDFLADLEREPGPSYVMSRRSAQDLETLDVKLGPAITAMLSVRRGVAPTNEL